MVDLKSQYLKIKDEIDSAILNVVESTQYINGPEVKGFQADLEKYLDVKHVIPCANGTDALQIAMMALGLEPGDEVIVPTYTYVATVEVIALLRLTPIFVDVDPKTFNIDIDSMKNALTPNTKAVVPVHLYGQTANMEEVMAFAEEKNIFVIEDTAQAIGSKLKLSNGESAYAGTIGDIGTTSFFPSKNLGCYGDGGAIFTNNDELAKKLRMIANHGQSVRYYHDSIGVNSRLDSIQAAVLRVKLAHLDSYNEARGKVAEYYNNAFKDIPELTTPFQDGKSNHVFHQYTLISDGIDRDGMIDYLKSKDIPSMIYYPVPVHLQKAYKTDKYGENSFPICEDLCRRVFSLPIHTEMSIEQLEYITNEVKNFIKK